MNDIFVTVEYENKIGTASLSAALTKGYDLAKDEDRELLIDRYLKSTLYAALKYAAPKVAAQG